MPLEDRVRKVEIKFIQISAGTVGLYGLDEDGGVWQYFPATKDTGGKVIKPSGWYRLTPRGLDATRPSGLENDEEGKFLERDRRLK